MSSQPIDRRSFIKGLDLGVSGPALSGSLGSWTCPAPAGRPPNVIIINTEDQGYADLGSYGAWGFTTPNNDRLAAEGMRFTHCYVTQAVSSAPRAAARNLGTCPPWHTSAGGKVSLFVDKIEVN